MDSSANAENHGAATCFHSAAHAAYRGKVGSRVIDYLPRNPTPARHDQSELASRQRSRLRDLSSRPVAMIRIDSIWLATEPMDMRAGTETALARVVAEFGAAKPHCAYLFANRRANRIKVLIHDGIGVWLAARRLNQGKFHWPGIRQGREVELDAEQLQALVLGLPWQRVGTGGAITLL
ncbi:IS66 family insertion sequence element accessory protein TnpB [Pseudomonas sp. F01002]|uniref:IS66 family insertion sequence element accessory protein TnpB n=1 Tax=Pseudomonas sp. F01002 TaxID=2555724 RepID=UPI002114DB17|nr:IS66 family insertion sequence element accessory protein TnpB [Pseudomonas sp. F01002]